MDHKGTVAIIIIVLAAGGYYWFSSGNNPDSANPVEEKSNAEIQKANIVRGFVEKYQANTGISTSTVYTVQLEDELVKTGKPVIFTASLDDIFRKDGEFFIRFAPSYYDFFEPQIFYTLRGCTDKIDQLVAQKKDYFGDGEYIVVAKITNVEKPVVKIDGWASGEDVELELSQPDTFLAEGMCLDLGYVEGNSILETIQSVKANE
ncbi:hypothetical protein EXS57_02310 [Candidatus Kaiserbacteria bacterium]|nr:hypothetical protein [Candidatus Kaiserbacteria bacterium]